MKQFTDMDKMTRKALSKIGITNDAHLVLAYLYADLASTMRRQPGVGVATIEKAVTYVADLLWFARCQSEAVQKMEIDQHTTISEVFTIGFVCGRIADEQDHNEDCKKFDSLWGSQE
jgi:hypothetical protein